MQIFDKPEIKPPKLPRGVGLGFFDGVHRGHQELLRTLVHESRRTGLQPAVYTFPRHPESVLRPAAPFVSYLCDLEDRLALLAECGIAETHLQPFDATFASISAADFLNRVLGDHLQAELIVAGHDYRFGHGGAGNVILLKNWAKARGIRVIIIEQVRIGGDRVSSSRLRKLISQGEIDAAAMLLGRPYCLRGQVVPGRQLGRKLGFPTANLPVPPDLACPAYGVYASRTRVAGRTYSSITHVGLRPTVDQQATLPLTETYLYDTDMQLYGKDIHIDFLQMIRPEIKFDSLLQLSRQVGEDLETVRDWHRRNEQCHEKAVVNGIPLYILPTGRFAQAIAHFVFYVPLEKRRTACVSLLSRVLTASCRRFPSRTSLAAALDNMYGSSIESNQERQGDLQIVMFSAEGLMKWTDGSSPFREACALMFDLLMDPLLTADGLFDEAIVEAERNNLLLELAARENDRAKYAFDRCLAMFCGEQPHGLHPAGDPQSVAGITREELRHAYEQLLSGCSAAFFVGGPIEAELVEDCIAELGRFPEIIRPAVRPAEVPAPFTPAGPTALVERKAVEQARIALALHGLPPYFSHRSIVATLLNSMLGGDVHSMLFDVVREKMGLAYSVFSINLRSISAMFILAGVAPDRLEAALEAIRVQIGKLAAGDFDSSLFERSRQMIESSILSVNDDLSSMMAQQIYSRLYGRVMSRGESLAAMRQVTVREVCALAAEIRPVSCFILSGHEQVRDISFAGLPLSGIEPSEVKHEL